MYSCRAQIKKRMEMHTTTTAEKLKQIKPIKEIVEAKLCHELYVQKTSFDSIFEHSKKGISDS